jgi:hypothetical protein
MIHLPRQAKLTLEFTLRRGREQITRKVTVNYPKKLYPFELKQEVTALSEGFKTMVRVMGELSKEAEKARPKVRLHPSRKLKRRRRSGPQLALRT